MAENRSYVDTEDIELSVGKGSTEDTEECYSYEEALDLTGNGKYNIGLLLACFVVITAMGIEIFGLGTIMLASARDLGMSGTEFQILDLTPLAGIVVMSYPWGYLSDRKGRKMVLMVAMGGSFITSTLSCMSTSWEVLALFKFLGSAFCSAAGSATYALLGECCSASRRAKYMLLMTSALMLAPTIYNILAHFILKLEFAIPISFLGINFTPWRLLTLVMALPLGVGALALHFFRESPKFLASVGRDDEAVEVLRKMHQVNNGTSQDYVVNQIYLEEDVQVQENKKFTLKSLLKQIMPLFKKPFLLRTIELYYLTFVVYVAYNSRTLVISDIYNVFFTSYEINVQRATGFCDLLVLSQSTDDLETGEASMTITQNFNYTKWADRVQECSFFLLNVLISLFARKRRILTMAILIIAAVAAILIVNIREPITGLVMFLIFMTTAMVFGVISSYFVDLYPTSYRCMVISLGMVVARLSGAVVSYFLPTDT